ncbi:TPA: FaeA/PapI family transcriptional regulator [Citrobacter freundii]
MPCDIYDAILVYMRENEATVHPLKTRSIADGIGVSVYSARYYLHELSNRNLVESDDEGKGHIIRWYLIK